MKIRNILLSLCAVVALNVVSAELPDSVLRRCAARMLMVGFRGDSITEESDAARYVRDLGVGGIILFDIDLTGSAKIGSRNITEKKPVGAADCRFASGSASEFADCHRPRRRHGATVAAGIWFLAGC